MSCPVRTFHAQGWPAFTIITVTLGGDGVARKALIPELHAAAIAFMTNGRSTLATSATTIIGGTPGPSQPRSGLPTRHPVLQGEPPVAREPRRIANSGAPQAGQ